jgi:hypothetical protein
VCLVAAMLLWAPLWAAAWQTDGMGCCKGGMCLAYGLATRQPTSGEQESAPMDCGHGKRAGLAACEMKCCHDAGATFVAAIIFVMPEQMKISAPTEASDTLEKAQAVISSILFEPPSPPPRSIVSVA